VPAAAVIPAPVAYIKVVAVKKLVVGFLAWCARPTAAKAVSAGVRLPSFRRVCLPFTGLGTRSGSFTLKKLECLKQTVRFLNTLAWNNKIGLWSYFVGFLRQK
jgi:hypothetical protein